MRWFFILLTLTNLALAGWLYWQAEAPRPVPEPAKLDSAQRKLQLLGELPQQSLRPIPHVASASEEPSATNNTELTAEATPSELATAKEDVPNEASAICMRISPLTKAADVESIARKLEKLNLPVVDSGEGVTERQTYWVVIPPYKTNKLARDASAQLAKAKVRDFLVVRTGEFENGISLGLFSQKEGAENRLREILALNLNIRRPEIRLRASTVSSHWLIARVSDHEAFKTLQQQIDAEGLQGTPVECPR